MQAVRDIVSSAPSQAAELEGLKGEVAQLRDASIRQSQQLAVALADLATARRAADDNERRASQAEQRLEASQARCGRAEAEAHDTSRAHSAALADWTNAVRLLRDKLSAAATRIRRLQQELADQALFRE